MKNRLMATAVVAAFALTPALTACSSDSNEAATDTATSSAATSASETATDAAATSDVELVDGTVRAKAAKDAENGSDMTAIFGTLKNGTDEDIHVIGFTTSLGEAMYEIHEVVDGVMQEKEGGIVIPAGGTYELKPGGDHFLVMGYPDEIPAGDTVDVTLLTDGGTTIDIPEVAVRTMLPGDEDYGEDGQVMDHSQHKHGDDVAHGEHAEHSETAEHKH